MLISHNFMRDKVKIEKSRPISQKIGKSPDLSGLSHAYLLELF
jgi:hypothetical protein